MHARARTRVVLAALLAVLATLLVQVGSSPATAAEPLKLPWAAGAWNVTQGPHTTNAWDIQPPGAGSHNNEVLAIASGVAKLTCTDAIGQAVITLTVSGVGTFKYAHLQTSAVQAAGVTTGGVSVVQGQVLGRLLPSSGSFSSTCGSGTASHLHLEMPSLPIVVDGVTFSAGGPTGGQLSSTNASVGAGSSPIGSFDELASPQPGTVRVRGWALDMDARTTPINVHVYVGGPAGSGDGTDIGPAGGSRPDVGAAYPGVGNNHGFDATIETSRTGNVPVYVYAINAGGTGGGNVLLGTRTIAVASGNPYGSFDGASSTIPGKVRISGWAIDPSARTTSVTMHLYVGGPAGAPGAVGYDIGPANDLRTDVGTANPGAGNTHGYERHVAIRQSGTLDVYLYAIDLAGTPGDNVLLGTKKVTVLPAPQPMSATATPTLHGRAKVGKRLSVSGDGWSQTGVTLTYQWLRNGTPVAGATGSSYQLRKADAGKRLTVVVTATKDGYATATAETAASKKVKKKAKKHRH